MKSKNKYVIMFFVIAGLFYAYSRFIKTEYEFAIAKEELISLTQNLQNRKEFEGRYLFERKVDILNEFHINQINGDTSNRYIFLVVDSIECYTCFKFHMENLNNIDLPIFFYSKSKTDLVKYYLPNSVAYSRTDFIKDFKINFSNRIIVMMLTNEGRIMYIDIADKKNYDKSRAFYQILEKYSNPS